MKRKEKKRYELMQKQQREALIDEINAVQNEMAVTLNNFSNTTEDQLLEYYMYAYKANTIKHGYLMKELKKMYYHREEE